MTGTILLANMDYAGLMDYTLKAVIGGAIWMAYKVVGDFFSRRMSKKRNDQKNEA